MAVQISGNDITVPRDGSFTRNVTIGGTLTYEDVTNIDSVGLITARTGIEIGARPGVAASISVDGNMIVSGITTFGGNVTVPGLTATSFLSVGDDDNINLGDGNDLKIYHQSSDNNSYIENDTGNLTIRADAANKDITLQAADVLIFNTGGANERLRITSAGQIVMGATTSKAKFEIKDNGYTSTTVLQRISADDANPYALIIANDTCNTSAASGLQIFVGNAGTHYIRARGSSTAGNNNLLIQAQNDIRFGSGSSETERLRIDSDGRVMIGQTSSVVPFMITATASNFGGENTTGVFGDATSYASGVGGGITLSGKYNSGGSQVGFGAIRGRKENGTDGDYDGALTFATRPNGGNMTERARITSGGKFNIGDTANTGYALMVKTTGSSTAIARFENTFGDADGTEISIYHNTASPADGDQTAYLQFTGNDSSGNTTIYNAIIGYTADVTDGTEDGDFRFFCRDAGTFSQKLKIASDGTFTGSSSNDISDQRLKDNIATVVDPITKIKALKGRTFTWKPEAKLPAGTKYGFIAQEVETVVSDLVDDKHGIRQFDKDGNLIPEDEKARVNTDEGTTDSKSVNAIGVVPILVEALKEALVKIETLETKVAALEGS